MLEISVHVPHAVVKIEKTVVVDEIRHKTVYRSTRNSITHLAEPTAEVVVLERKGCTVDGPSSPSHGCVFRWSVAGVCSNWIKSYA